MPEVGLAGCRVLVIEDEFILAEELNVELNDAGAIVLGPVGYLEDAFDLIDAETRIDGAILDVNLGGEPVYPVADRLLARGVPMVFTTGYSSASIPERFAHVVRCEKPIVMSKVAEAMRRAIEA